MGLLGWILPIVYIHKKTSHDYNQGGLGIRSFSVYLVTIKLLESFDAADCIIQVYKPLLRFSVLKSIL